MPLSTSFIPWCKMTQNSNQGGPALKSTQPKSDVGSKGSKSNWNNLKNAFCRDVFAIQNDCVTHSYRFSVPLTNPTIMWALRITSLNPEFNGRHPAVFTDSLATLITSFSMMTLFSRNAFLAVFPIGSITALLGLNTKSPDSESSIAIGRLHLTFLPLGLSLWNLAHLFIMFMATHPCLRLFNFCLGKGKGKGKVILFNVGGQTGKDCLLTWADGVKVANRRDRTCNLSLRKRCTNHCTTRLSYGLSKSKKRRKNITKLWKTITRSLGKSLKKLKQRLVDLPFFFHTAKTVSVYRN